MAQHLRQLEFSKIIKRIFARENSGFLKTSKHACYIVLSILWWETGRENGSRTTHVPTPGRFFYFEWKLNPMPGLGRLSKPITGGGGILIHSLTRVTPPPPPSKKTSVLSNNKVFENNRVIFWDSIVKM